MTLFLSTTETVVNSSTSNFLPFRLHISSSLFYFILLRFLSTLTYPIYICVSLCVLIVFLLFLFSYIIIIIIIIIIYIITIFIVIIIIIIISFMEGIYSYIPETNYVPREYCVAAILLLLFMVLLSLVSVLNLLYFYISTFRSMCAVPNMAVLWISLTLCFPGMLLTYFLNDVETFPVAPIITGVTFVLTFHMCCISTVRSSYFNIFSASFLILYLSPEIATSFKLLAPDSFF